MSRSERDELRARIWACVRADALSQAAILVRRIHDAGLQLLPDDYVKLPIEVFSST